jgi:phage terminase large subunit-like protein
MSFPETIETCKILNETYDSDYPTFIVEDVAYQKALPQQLRNEGMNNVETTRPGNCDKRSRLLMTSHLVKTGKILFPKEGCEELISQIVNFGIEKHDDLADAFSNVILHIIESPPYFVGIA